MRGVYKNLPTDPEEKKRKWDETIDSVLDESPKAKIFVDTIKEGKLVGLNDRETSCLYFFKKCCVSIWLLVRKSIQLTLGWSLTRLHANMHTV